MYCRSKRRCEPASEDKHEERRDNGLLGKKSAGWGWLGRGGFNLCGGAGRENVAAGRIQRGGANPMFFSFPEIFIGPSVWQSYSTPEVRYRGQSETKPTHRRQGTLLSAIRRALSSMALFIQDLGLRDEANWPGEST